MKILILGDSHIPLRAKELPKRFLRVLKTQKFDFSIFTGNLTSKDVLDVLKSHTKVYAISGNMDNIDLPKKLVVNAYGFKIGIIHGHKIRPKGNIKQLVKYAKDRDLDILVSGHSHIPHVTQTEGVLLLNPGSITGVWGGKKEANLPSFGILHLKERIAQFELVTISRNRLIRKIKNFSLSETAKFLR